MARTGVAAFGLVLAGCTPVPSEPDVGGYLLEADAWRTTETGDTIRCSHRYLLERVPITPYGELTSQWFAQAEARLIVPVRGEHGRLYAIEERWTGDVQYSRVTGDSMALRGAPNGAAPWHYAGRLQVDGNARGVFQCQPATGVGALPNGLSREPPLVGTWTLRRLLQAE